jgi:Tfp pilus assembly PilM family ATPase
MARSSIGIYISSRYIDIVEIAGSKMFPEIINFARQEIPPKSKMSGEGLEENIKQQQDRISVAIKEGLDRLKLKAQLVQTVLPSNDVMVRYFDMPLLPKSEQPQAIRFEARKYVPFKLDKIKSDFKILVSSKNKKTMDVFFIAATKDRLDAHLSTFQGAGLQISGIDIVPFALLRALMLDKVADAKDTIAIVYVDNDRENVSIHIMETGMPFMSRDIHVDADDKDAFFDKVASELRVSIDYYCGQKPKHDISKIILCGEEFFTGLDAYISDELKIITETLYSFKRIKGIDKLASPAIIAVGLALGGLGKSNYSVDLSPFTTTLKKKRAFNIVFLEILAAIFIVASVYILSVFAGKVHMDELKQVQEIAASLPEATSSLDIDQLVEQRTELMDYFKFLLLAGQRTLLANKLSAVSKHITTKGMQSRATWVDRFNFKESFVKRSSKYPSEIARTLSIEASIFTSDDSVETDYINMFFESLKEDTDFMRYFTDIELGAIERSSIKGYWVSNFMITAFSGKMAGSETPRARR